MYEDLIEKKVSSEAIFDGVLLHVKRDTVELPNGKDVDADEAADAGFEIQDEDDVFGLLNDSYTMDSDADSENE